MSRQVCRLCLKTELAEEETFSKMSDIKPEIVETVLPEINFTLSKEPFICGQCLESLISAYDFKFICLESEEKLCQYICKIDKPAQDQVDLFDLVVNVEDMVEDHDSEQLVLNEISDCDLLEIGAEQLLTMPIDDIDIQSSPEEMSIEFSEPTKQSEINEEKPYNCNFCSKTFAQKLHLHGHLLNKHKDIKNLEQYITSKIHYCKHCEYKTINNYNLGKHLIAKHKDTSGVRKFTRYSCEYCNYTTANQGNFKHHLDAHKGKMKFPCNFCEKSFVQKINMAFHMLRMHPEQSEGHITNKIYSCERCPYKTVSQEMLLRHTRSHKKYFYISNII